ncbi:MAG: hypothetical protein JSS28_06655 [Proteobacteria bacterium]|nr:hypothetical protein [Pseudomonadota bacterium]
MKRFTSIAIAVGMLATTSLAGAAGNQLTPVKVEGSTQLAAACTPPNDSAICSAWHAVVRANFTPREIGMLFGARTSYPNYGASFDRIQARYNVLQGEFAATHAIEMNAVAAK